MFPKIQYLIIIYLYTIIISYIFLTYYPTSLFFLFLIDFPLIQKDHQLVIHIMWNNLKSIFSLLTLILFREKINLFNKM